MRRTTMLIAALLVTAAVPVSATAATEDDPIVVVVSVENPTDHLDADSVRRIFMRLRTKWPDGSSITVYDRHSESPIREEFTQRVLRRSLNDMRDYWLDLSVTRGMEPPRVCRSATLLSQLLRRVAGGVGYMRASEVDGKLKIVHVVGVDP